MIKGNIAGPSFSIYYIADIVFAAAYEKTHLGYVITPLRNVLLFHFAYSKEENYSSTYTDIGSSVSRPPFQYFSCGKNGGRQEESQNEGLDLVI